MQKEAASSRKLVVVWYYNHCTELKYVTKTDRYIAKTITKVEL